MTAGALFAPFLAARGVVIVDGALATELERRGADLSDALWSARVLLEQPALIRAVHDDYVAAGADIAITSTYQATFEGLGRRGLDAGAAAALMRRAVQLAVESRDAFWAVAANRTGRARPLVAASVGPYGAFLADGSEYRGDYALDEEGLVEWHRARFHLLASSGADLLACETIPCAAEARALRRLLHEVPGVQAWFSFTAQDGARLPSGERFAEVVAECDGDPQVAAVGINCTAPAHVESLVRAARAVTATPILVYPNSGECWLAAERRWTADRDGLSLASGAPVWRDAGATIFGGCCRTTPADIAALVRELTAERGA
ncbi:MAG: homocysteine S-methyltransferase [Gemmatimonadaceae bacterium]|nr:homocysteine S-methyltransferase [Gemmatimonadaceae bacterium]